MLLDLAFLCDELAGEDPALAGRVLDRLSAKSTRAALEEAGRSLEQAGETKAHAWFQDWSRRRSDPTPGALPPVDEHSVAKS